MPCPDCCQTSLLETISQVATIAGAAGVLLAYLTLLQSRNSFHQTIIVSCTKRFQKLSPKLQGNDISDKTVQQYLELCNEELFYFEQKYLPQGIIDEWVEGMVSLIGVWHGGQCLLPASPHATLFYQQAKEYPRLRHTFTLSGHAQHQVAQAAHHQPAEQQADRQRAQAVLEVLANLRQYQQQPFYAYLTSRRRERLGSV